ncbi:MAG: hypothetical protein ABS84_17190 [Rubrivivax sp. SCN 71-131]|nr:MAG: hypothetical protein ABS84_17190 [Rubrivivax sp. SCN 71-131]
MRSARALPAALIAALAIGAVPALPAPQVGDALDRPAVGARDAAHAVLLTAAQAGTRLVVAGERGIVLTSDDAGQSWRQSRVPVSVSLTALRFADAAHGYLVGHGGTVLATDDGGLTWTRQLDGRTIARLELDAARAGGDAAALKSAERLVADGPDKPLLDLLVLDAQRAVVVGAYGLALATDDGGASWSSWRGRLDDPKELHFYAVRKRGDRIAVAGEQGLLRLSTDAGRTFKRIATPYQGSFFTLEMPSDGEIVVAGLRGNVWRSVDDGANWSQLASSAPVSITASTQRADGSLVFVNQAGMVLELRQGSLQALPAGLLPPLNGLVALSDGALLTVSIDGVRLIDVAAVSSQASGLWKK